MEKHLKKYIENFKMAKSEAPVVLKNEILWDSLNYKKVLIEIH